MDMDSFGFKVIEIFSPVLFLALTWVAGRLAQLIRTKIQNEHLKNLLLRLDDAVLTVVKDLQQRMVQQAKHASVDGKITEDEKKLIKETALALVKVNLGAVGRVQLSRTLGMQDREMEVLLSSKIEAAVHDLHHPVALPGGAAMGKPAPTASPTLALVS